MSDFLNTILYSDNEGPNDQELSNYTSFWSKADINDIYPNINSASDGAKGNVGDGSTSSSKLESVSVYKVIDLLGEGSFGGLVNQNNELITLSTDITKNENAFRAIYLNDVPVKNTNSEFFNYNRMFVEFRNGTENQPLLSSSKNPALSFSASSQTFNINVNIPGLSLSERESLSSSVKFPFSLQGVENGFYRENEAVSAMDIRSNIPSVYYNSDHKNIQVHLEEVYRKLAVKVSHAITNDNVDTVEVGLKVDSLFFQHRDERLPYSTVMCIKVGYENDTRLLGDGGSLVYIFCPISGIATSQYVRSVLIKLPPAIGGKNRHISVFKLSIESELVQASNNSGVSYISEHVTTSLSYPNSAIIASIFDARAFASIPKRSYDVRMLEVLVPTNYDPETRQYKGNWFGEFSLIKKWTDNPAWHFFDLASNQRYGLGKYGFKEGYIDKWNLYSISKYCDELVHTGFTSKFKEIAFTIKKGGTEITIDDSSSNLGSEALLDRFPEGGTVCLYDLEDSDSNELGFGFKRIIYNPSYDDSTSLFTFTILNEISSKFIFESYPNIKNEYLSIQGEKSEAKQWILENYVINKDNNETSESFTFEFLKGEPIDSSVVSGVAATHFENNLPLLEPRFSCNVYLDKEQDAYNALNDLASVFRGLVYWSNSYLFITNDQYKSAIYPFTNANVKDGNFVYTGGSKTTRFTAVLVRYNDQYDGFKPKVEYIEDPAGIREYGYLEKKVISIGTTSRSQAHRMGKWILTTSQTESELIQFTTGAEASTLRPGDVIRVQDKLKSTKRYGGRILDINYPQLTVTIDKAVEENIVGQLITFIVPKTMNTARDLNEDAKSRLQLHLQNPGSSNGITDEEINQMRQSQIQQFTITSVENNIVTVSGNQEDFSLISKGSIWTAENLDSEIQIKDVKYRIISLTEQSPNEYEITGLIYNESKFSNIDSRKSIEKTQFSKPQIITQRTKPSALSSSEIVSVEELRDVEMPLTGEISFNSFDASYIIEEELSKNLKNLNLKSLFVNFSNIAVDSGVTSNNTNGYVVDVYKDGERVRFELKGYDKTSFSVFLGSRDDFTNITYSIYRRDTNNNLESIGLPI